MSRVSFIAVAALLLLVRAAPGVAVGTATNLAPNPSFEQPPGAAAVAPEGWSYFTTKTPSVGLSRDNKHSGEQCVRLKAQGAVRSFQGLLVTLEVAAGGKYTFSAYVTNNRDDLLSGTAYGSLQVEWLDASGKEISRTVSRTWNTNLSRMRWEPFSITKVRVPPGAVRASFGIHMNDGDGAAKGSAFVDDVVITKD